MLKLNYSKARIDPATFKMVGLWVLKECIIAEYQIQRRPAWKRDMACSQQLKINARPAG